MAFSICPSSPCSTIPCHVSLSSRVVMETNYLYKLSPCPHLTLSVSHTISIYISTYYLHFIYYLLWAQIELSYKCSERRLRASPFWLPTSDLLHHSSYSQQSLVCVRGGCLPRAQSKARCSNRLTPHLSFHKILI